MVSKQARELLSKSELKVATPDEILNQIFSIIANQENLLAGNEILRNNQKCIALIKDTVSSSIQGILAQYDFAFPFAEIDNEKDLISLSTEFSIEALYMITYLLEDKIVIGKQYEIVAKGVFSGKVMWEKKEETEGFLFDYEMSYRPAQPLNYVTMDIVLKSDEGGE